MAPRFAHSGCPKVSDPRRLVLAQQRFELVRSEVRRRLQDMVRWWLGPAVPLLQVLTLLALQRLRVALVTVLVLMRASLPMLQ